ncbi:uncharacterized protein [Procambarus clarkii]|uniref:uncharacterized protein n=1 Tax=Procambarus clarkii TaxID=6728 RepID=UPI00374271B7
MPLTGGDSSECSYRGIWRPAGPRAAGRQRPRGLPPSVQVVVAVVVLGVGVDALPGTFITDGSILNKWLPSGMIDSITAVNQTDCEAACVGHPKCNGYAVSAFERKCVRYSVKPGMVQPVQNNGYVLYVLQRNQDDGYTKFNDGYIRLVLKRLNAYEARKACAADGGHLVAVTDTNITCKNTPLCKNSPDGTISMNEMLHKALTDANTFRALIGLSDENTEGVWLYSDGTPATYTNWAWNGMWPRTDRNCALVTSHKGVFRMVNCWDKNYFFCQLPMF